MTLKKPTMLTPERRFPEFRDADFHDVKLGDVTEDSTTRNKAKFDADVVMGVFKGEGMQPMEERLVAKDISRYKVVQKDAFAYNPMRINIGSIARWHGDNPVLVSPDYVVFNCSANESVSLNPNYLDHFRESDQWDRFVNLTGDGSVRVRIYYKDLATLKLRLPAPAEQQKIADCLGSLDDWIAAAGRKLAALRDHKRGLLQQLFPKPGQSQPQQRFPEFRDQPKWASKCLADFDPYVTSGARGWASYYADSGDLFVRITNLTRESIYLDLSKCKYVCLPSEASEGKRTQLKTRDLLVSVTADIGIIGYVSEDVPSPAYINQHIALVRFDIDSVCSKFVAYYLASETSQRHFRSSTDNGTKAGMNLTGVQNMKVMIPGIEEQQKIAACLTTLDTQITAQAAQLDTLHQHKRGLMQQLFPTSEDQL